MATATTTSARSCSTWEAEEPVCAPAGVRSVHVVACTVHTQLCTERYKARSLGEGGTGAREAGQGRNKWSTIHSSDTGCSAQICVSHFAPTLDSGAGTVLLWEDDRSEKWVKKRGPAEKYKKYRKLNKWSRSRVNGSLILGRIVIRGNLLQEYSPKSGRQILRRTYFLLFCTSRKLLNSRFRRRTTIAITAPRPIIMTEGLGRFASSTHTKIVAKTRNSFKRTKICP